MGKSVGDNYNVYPVGAEPVSRRYHDTRSQLTHVQMNSEIPGAGEGNSIRLQPIGLM